MTKSELPLTWLARRFYSFPHLGEFSKGINQGTRVVPGYIRWDFQAPRFRGVFSLSKVDLFQYATFLMV
jgi:hypothetical protein